MIMQLFDRRKFLKTLGIAGAATLTGIPALALRNEGLDHLTILHTNDTHSRIDPFPDNDPNFPGQGGYARRSQLISLIRKENPDLLLLDAGDIFQGTPYFNIYGGKVELKLMSKMGYDAAAFGNHEFDNGMDGFLNVLPNADFPFLAANYDFSETILKDKVKPYVIKEKNGKRIGIYGLGIQFEGLVSRAMYGDTIFIDPIEKAQEIERILWKQHNCDLIICLSHLGFDYDDDRIGDTTIAANTKYTDIIIGGHTHSLLDPPAEVYNLLKNKVIIAQAGYGGAYLGRLDVFFNNDDHKKFVESYTTKI